MSAPELEYRFVSSSPEQILANARALEPYTRDAEAPADLAEQPSKFRTSTKIWLAFAAVSILLWFDMPPVGLLASLIAIPGALVTGGNDLLQESARNRRTSRGALRCFLRSVKLGRWREAHAALGEPARAATETVPQIEALGSSGDTVEMSSPKGVKRYWKTLVRSTGGMTRTMLGFSAEPLWTKGDVHRYRVTVRMRAYSTAYALLMLFFGVIPGLVVVYLFFTKTFRSSYEVYVYKHKSQWWLMSGKLGLPDRVAKLPAAKVVK